MSDSRFDESRSKPSGTVDERAVYFRNQSLVLASRVSFQSPAWPRATDPPRRRGLVDTCGLMGASGLELGPHVHLLDECGLADPLLARMPSVFNSEWRIGHFRRLIPGGYRESLEEGGNLLRDEQLAMYYERIRSVTRGPVFSGRRFADIWGLNTGAYDDLIDRRYYRHSGSIVPIDALTPAASGEAAARRLDLPLAITCDDRPGRRYLDVALDSDDRYLVEFVKDNRIIAALPLGPVPAHRRTPGLAVYTENLPVAAVRHGFDTIIIAPVSGENFAIGHLLLDGESATDAELERRVLDRDRNIPR